MEGSRVYFNDASLDSTTIRKCYRVKSVSTTLTKTAISMDLIRREIDSAEHQPKNSDEWFSAMVEIVKNHSGGKFDGISEDRRSALAVRQEAEVTLVEYPL